MTTSTQEITEITGGRALTMAMMLTTTMMTTSMQQITEITREQTFDDGDVVDVDNNNARKVTQRL